MKKNKDKFTITFTEKDRLAAGPFFSNYNCLVATALLRRGFKNVNEGVVDANLDGANYSHTYAGASFVCEIFEPSKEGPFYAPEVVGKKLTFVRDPH